MPVPLLSVEEFVHLYNSLGPRELSRRTDQSERSLQARAQRLRRKGIRIESPKGPSGGWECCTQRIPEVQADECELKISNGFGIIASDAHYWPGEETLMHRALLWACKEFKPAFCILNGDVMDLPSISRHQRIGWEKQPEVCEEIEWAQEKTHEIVSRLPKGARKIWTLGNHDARFETFIANVAPKYAKVHGVHLKDHFPLWEPAWSVDINPELGQFGVLVKHRFRGGIHAVHNNLLWTGNHIVTGHLHSAQVRALTLHRERTIWGVDSGCLAEPSARAFQAYTEKGPKNWRSAFVILRWEKGALMQPQLVLKFDRTRVQLGLDIITP